MEGFLRKFFGKDSEVFEGDKLLWTTILSLSAVLSQLRIHAIMTCKVLQVLEGDKLLWATNLCLYLYTVPLQVWIHAMVTCWEGVGCSEGMEADLNDRFTFLSIFMLVSYEEFGSC